MNKTIMFKSNLALGVCAFVTFIAACTKNDDATTVDPAASTTTITEVVKANYKSMVTVSTSGNTITLKSEGVPDHVTPYWGVGNALYEAQKSDGALTPGSLRSQNFVMTLTATPTEATTKEATSLGPIGMALNGVAIYNDREGGNVPVDAAVLQTMDRGGAHSGPGGLYHYHFDGDFTSKDDAKLIGFLRDGFPIYGRKDMDGSYPSNLDTNGGHTAATADFPNGVYHYHSSAMNYLNSGYYILKAGSYHGTKGTFTF
ncbi:YHYH protein [Persicitalea jodogahamensis]|uniref:YHYH domain-containing protein n=1 Tax=Persicitalea jodogahamensis TaxID=402147 RepID=A0A8J3GAS5_9BACT|nr:YHYH protein [Persicitalea jodogahamensis]GHB76916.1 hypothetical protein GCM10007390_33620 [Persicitalea jodogahamensis]